MKAISTMIAGLLLAGCSGMDMFGGSGMNATERSDYLESQPLTGAYGPNNIYFGA
jgi:hypothetical protein